MLKVTVTANIEFISVQGSKLIFEVEAHDEVDVISRGRYERMIINKEQFEERIRSKLICLANAARQADITQEISEIVGGADALASASAGSE